MPCRALSTLVAVAAALVAARAHAGGFELVEHSPEAVATAGAQTADANAAAAAYYNPAALAFQPGVTARPELGRTKIRFAFPKKRDTLLAATERLAAL